MLNSVPKAVNASVRQVVLRHPNSFDCTIARKHVTRTEGNSQMGGAPTLGGMGVLRDEDEAEFEYVSLGPARLLFAGQPVQQADMNDRDDAMNPPPVVEAQIEPTAEPGATGHFDTETGDLVMVDLGLGVVLAYEVVTVSGSLMIPPFVRRFALNPQPHLNNLEPFAG